MLDRKLGNMQLERNRKMREIQKQKALEFVQLLGQAHSEIKQMIEIKNNPTALSLLEQCQQGAIQLGTMIEESEGEGFVTVGMLETYCELVYQVHE